MVARCGFEGGFIIRGHAKIDMVLNDRGISGTRCRRHETG